MADPYPMDDPYLYIHLPHPAHHFITQIFMGPFGFVRTAAPAITDIPTFIYFLIKAPTICWNYKFALCHPCLGLQVRIM